MLAPWEILQCYITTPRPNSLAFSFPVSAAALHHYFHRNLHVIMLTFLNISISADLIVKLVLKRFRVHPFKRVFMSIRKHSGTLTSWVVKSKNVYNLIYKCLRKQFSLCADHSCVLTDKCFTQLLVYSTSAYDSYIGIFYSVEIAMAIKYSLFMYWRYIIRKNNCNVTEPL